MNISYSVVVPYRNRNEHLSIFVPKIKEYFVTRNLMMELIVVEQGEPLKKFNRGGLLNCGHRYAMNEIIIDHDVDYIPSSNTIYYEEPYDVYLPVKRAIFCYNDFQPKPI